MNSLIEPPPRIVTLTLNPAIDLATTTGKIQPTHKMRTTGEHIDAGGGGINVARVITALGGETLAVLTAGGATGRFLCELLEEAGVPHRKVPIEGRSRVSFNVIESDTGQEYRFVPEGPQLGDFEWQAALDAVDEAGGRFVVASGSIPSGVPIDIYATAAARASALGRRFVLDTSGPALRAALGQNLYLMKPSLSELESLVGESLPGPAEQDAEALKLVRAGAADMIAVTLGAEGAILATAAAVIRRPALRCPVHSTVGAGDAFLASMVLALARGAAPEDALDWGIAAGAAAVARIGTARVSLEDVTGWHDTPLRGVAR